MNIQNNFLGQHVLPEACYFDREIYLSWLTGFRILTEGSVLDYYGDDGPGEYG